MDVGCTLDLGEITDLGCGNLTYIRIARYLCDSWASSLLWFCTTAISFGASTR